MSHPIGGRTSPTSTRRTILTLSITTGITASLAGCQRLFPDDESTDEPPEDDTDSNQKTKPDEDDGFEEARKYLTGQTEYSHEVILDTLPEIR